MFEIRKPSLTAETRQGLPGSYVELPSGVTHYEVRGAPDGRCVVLIHGNAAPYVSWDNTIEDLVGAGLRVLRYDVLGHGFSDRPPRHTYDNALYVAQLAELIDRLGIAYPVSVVGTSQGGSIGAHFAAAYPGRVDRLGLLAPLFDDYAGKGSLLETIMTTPLVGEFLLTLVGDSKIPDLTGRIADPDKKAALESEVAKQLQFRGKPAAILANLRGDSFTHPTAAYEQVKTQGIPILLLWGTEDKLLPEESMRRLRDLIPDIEYHQIDRASHLAHYEYPERVTPILVEFLTRGQDRAVSDDVEMRSAGTSPPARPARCRGRIMRRAGGTRPAAPARSARRCGPGAPAAVVGTGRGEQSRSRYQDPRRPRRPARST